MLKLCLAVTAILDFLSTPKKNPTFCKEQCKAHSSKYLLFDGFTDLRLE